MACVLIIKHSTLQVTDDVQQKYYDFMMKCAGEADDAAKDNVSKVDNIMLNGKRIKWENILELEKKLRKEQFASNAHLLVAQISLILPRRLLDYAKMEVFKGKSEFDKSKEPNKMLLDTRNKCAHMSISDYKTAKAYGAYEAKLTGVLYEVIKTSLAEHKRKFLFENTNHDPCTSGTFSKYVTDTFKKVLGVSLGMNNIRHLKVTDFNKGNPSLRQREELAWQMGSSVALQNYYNQPDTDATRAARAAEKNDKLAQTKKSREQVDSCIKKIAQLSQELIDL
jgi:hypothetical protein